MQATNPQQLILNSIFSDLTQNYLVKGVAGAGKTWILSAITHKLVELGINENDILALTFSKELAKDMQEKLKGTVQTIHSKMYQVCSQWIKVNNIKRQGTKTSTGQWQYSILDENLATKVIKDYLKPAFGIALGQSVPNDKIAEFYSECFTLLGLVNAIRTSALHYDNDIATIKEKYNTKYTEKVVVSAIEILKTLNLRFFNRAQVDFIGMLYIPFINTNIFESRITKPKFLIIDETNDLSPILRSTINLLVDSETKLIAVGDEQQTIHIWSGTEPDCMERFKLTHSMKELEYEYTFRVPKKHCVYLNASGIDNRIKPYETNNTGTLERVSYNKTLSKLQNGDVVLCKFNRGNKVAKTLEAMSIEILQLGKKVALIGSTYLEDIKEILAYTSQSNNPSEFKNLAYYAEQAVLYIIAEEYTNSGLKTDSFKCKELRRKLETFKLYHKFFCNQPKVFFPNLKQFIAFLETMYEKTENAIQLCSIHRSKGKEWKTVYILHAEYMVEEINNQELPIDQRIEAHNLLLVALTRSLNNTFIIDYDLPSVVNKPSVG